MMDGEWGARGAAGRGRGGVNLDNIGYPMLFRVVCADFSVTVGAQLGINQILNSRTRCDELLRAKFGRASALSRSPGKCFLELRILRDCRQSVL